MSDSTPTDALVARLVEAAARVFPGTGIFVAYAHGSRIHGAPRPDSDLDVGYYLSDQERGGKLEIRAEMDLAVALSGAVGLDVDLRNLGTAPLEFRGRVLEEGRRIFCADEGARVNLERDLLGRYHDYKITLRGLHTTRVRRFAESGL